jgi:lipopolysaccharide cholinephosphotransferase
MYITPQDEVDQIYSLMGKTVEVLDESMIDYFVIAGTLLGAVRHSGMIPWDDDVDLMITETNLAKLRAAKARFNEIGLELSEHHWGFTNPFFKIWSKDSDRWQNNNAHTYPFIDIFVSKLDVDKKRLIPMGIDPEKARESKLMVFNESEVFPLQKYSFGPYSVNGPKNGRAYLERAYGADWETRAVQTHHHGMGITKPVKTEINLRKTPIKPALPSGFQMPRHDEQ